MSSGSLVFRSQRGYDAASNVTAVNTTLAAGTDNQVFCYDEQNRLVWAGSSGTPSCGSTLTPGTLTSASYTQPYAYDTLDRLTSGPLGSYSYGDSAHLHAATSIGTSYQAAYDAVGEMICRAPTSATNCAVPSGALLSYDNEGRLSHWQNAPSSPTTTDDFLYDGDGNRVEQQATISGSQVTTVYVAGGLEEITTSGITTTLTKYFAAEGLPTIERVGTGGPLSYLASDGQGSVSETLDGSGTVTFQQLYTPYGASRYSNGSSPTTLGYTGQRADANTGLDFYHARYYDPAAGQFTSADTVADGLNRYGYVGGNPTTNSDPSGHRPCYDGDASSCVPNGSPPPTTPPDNTKPPTATNGGGSGSNGGDPCTGPTSGQLYQTCLDAWKYKQLKPRQDALVTGYVVAFVQIALGVAMVEVADYEIAKTARGGREKILAIADMVETFVNLGSFLASAFPDAASTIYNVLGVLNGVLGMLHFVYSLIDTWGAFMNMVDTTLDALIMAVGGVPGTVENMVERLIGAAVMHGAAAFGHGVIAKGLAEYAEIQRQNNMDVGDWCRQYGKGVCTPEPTKG